MRPDTTPHRALWWALVAAAGIVAATAGCGGGGGARRRTGQSVDRPAIAPQPLRLIWGQGFFAQDAPTLGVRFEQAPSPAESAAAEAFTDTWRAEMGTQLGPAEAPAAAPDLAVRAPTLAEATSIPELADSEGYVVEVTPASAEAVAQTPAARAFALRTLEQLIVSGYGLRCVSIADRPAIRFRGLHLIANPKVYPTPRFYTALIEAAARLKYNAVVILFMGTIELQRCPEGVDRNAYPQAVMRPIIQRGRELGLEMVPEIKGWGHANWAWVRSRNVFLEHDPTLAPLFAPSPRPAALAPRTFCTGNPRVYAMLEAAAGELVDVFDRPRYFHMGGDEAWDHGTCASQAGRADDESAADHINQLAAIVEQQGCQMILWGDMLLDSERWGPGGANSRAPHATHGAVSAVDKDVIIADWNASRPGLRNSVRHFQDHGLRVIGALHGFRTYLDIVDEAQAVMDADAYGVLQTTWAKLKGRPGIIVVGAEAAWSGGQIDPYRLAYDPEARMDDLMRPHAGAGWRSRLRASPR